MTNSEQQQLREVCHSLFGVEVDIPRDFQGSTVGVSVAPQWDLFGTEIDLEITSLTFPQDFSTGEKDFGLQASVKWDAATVGAEFTVTVNNGQPSEMSFNLKLGELSSTEALQKLGSLFQATQDSWEVPDLFPKVGIAVREFAGRFSFQSGLVSFETMLVADFGDGWSPLTTIGIKSDLFALKTLVFAVRWEKGLRTSWRVGGMLEIEQAYHLTLEYTYPLNRAYAQLHPLDDADEKLAALFSDLGIPPPVTDIASKVLGKAALTLDADLKRKAFELKLTNDGDPWHVIGGVEVSSTELRIYCFEGKFAVGELFLELSLAIGTLQESGDREAVSVEIDATYDGEAKLWTFEGETGAGEDIAVGDAIDALVKKLGDGSPGQQLPEAISSLAVRKKHRSSRSIVPATRSSPVRPRSRSGARS